MSANTLSVAFDDLPAMFGAILEFQTLVQYAAYFVVTVLVTVVATLWIAGNRVTLRQSNGRPDESRRRGSLRRWFRSDDKGASGKRRRRRQRRRNPTLAETGGLPPIRTEPSASSTERFEQ